MTAKKQQLQINKAVEALQQGDVIAYPTEAVYGLGCDPNNIPAVKKILELKQREKEKGLILIAANFEQLKPYLLPLEKPIEKKLLESWNNADKPVTWIVPAKEEVSEYVKGKFNSVAVRVSHHPIVKQLCENFSGAIISTSANIAAKEAARTSEQAKDIFGDEIEHVIEGETNIDASPSEIRDAITDNIIRQSN